METDWVSIKERLPKRTDWYWCATDPRSDGKFDVYVYAHWFKNGKFIPYSAFDENVFVTHWTTMPNPPVS